MNVELETHRAHRLAVELFEKVRAIRDHLQANSQPSTMYYYAQCNAARAEDTLRVSMDALAADRGQQ